MEQITADPSNVDLETLGQVDAAEVRPKGDSQEPASTKLPDDTVAGTSESTEGSPKRKRSTFIDVEKNWRICLKQVIVRLTTIATTLAILGYMLGILFNLGASSLLSTAEEAGWKQVWRETRVRVLDDEAMMNSTYVHVYNKTHRRFDIHVDAPKLPSRWIYVYYLRGAAAMMVGYGSPFFIMLAMHGIQTMWKCVLVCYTPFAVLSVAICLANAYAVVNKEKPLVSDHVEIAFIGLLSSLEALVVLPLVGRYLRLHHVIKTVVIPFVLLNISLFGLKFILPVIVVQLGDWAKVFFRLIAFSIVSECFVGLARIFVRLVPLTDENIYRPEDKVFAVLGLDCLYGYWGRIIFMGLTNKWAMVFANFGNVVLEFIVRVSVVHRDRLYLGIMYRDFDWRTKFWCTNAKAMQRFRCSMVISHGFTEYLMIATAATFYLASGNAVDLPSHVFNCLLQLFSELVVDAVTLYWEIHRHKLPIIPAWFDRQKHWGFLFVLFVAAFNIFALSQAGAFYCAMRVPSDPARTMLLFCGAPK